MFKHSTGLINTEHITHTENKKEGLLIHFIGGSNTWLTILQEIEALLALLNPPKSEPKVATRATTKEEAK